MSGFEVLDAVLRDLDASDLAVLILTSSSARADREAASAYDCVHAYVEKPLTRAHLHDLARSLAP